MRLEDYFFQRGFVEHSLVPVRLDNVTTIKTLMVGDCR